MRGIVFAILTFIVGGLLGLGFEKLAALIGGQVGGALTRVYSVGIHPLSVSLSICGMVGLILGYLILEKFVRK